jgi:hypothetical protein
MVEFNDSVIVACYRSSVTKVQIRFRLQKPLDDSTLPHLAAANAIYGIQKLRVAPTLDSVDVEYDATRLKPADVAKALAAAGVPLAS